MSYHPIMGILLFIAFIILAFMLGKKINIQKTKKNILTIKKRKKIEMESIAPDANWIE
tara:strand:+ start:294 stop:467 length:174 start_codon:yes stop_codon:yes gene_type:complete